MKITDSCCRVLSTGIAAAVLAACGGSQSSITPTSLTATDARATHGAPAAGGAFSGAYSGSYSADCQISGRGRLTFNGTGSASFIHSSGEHGAMQGNCQNGQSWTGSATLASYRHPSDTIKVSLSGGFHIGPFLCEVYKCNFSVTSGTGKFKSASGSGTLIIKGTGYKAYTDTWSGTITY